jgi:AcrR family transcriptional regulator
MPRSTVPALPRDAYHHGDLRHALIAATEDLLAERGPEGFSLREVARRSGVSPAAPSHHFGDREGLLAAVTALGFEGLQHELREGRQRGGSDPVTQLREQGLGYVRFALLHPGRFRLMFGGSRPPQDDVQRAGRQAFGALEDGVRGLLGAPEGRDLDATERRVLLSVWSVVHGLAHLALAGQLDAWVGGPVVPPPGSEASRAMTERRRRLMEEVLPPLLAAHLAPFTGRSLEPRPDPHPSRERRNPEPSA